MNRADSICSISQEAFRILDERGGGILVLDRKMQVFWGSAVAMSLVCACEEEILGIDARRILDAHLTPLLQERDDAKRLLNAVHSGTETPGLDLSVQDPRGEERRIVYSSRKVERGTFAGMWVLCMRDVT